MARALPIIDTQMKLLLIEDNPTLQVLTCGDHSLALWQASLPDAALLDLSLAGRDGLQVLGEALTAVLRTPGITLTARGTAGDRIIGLNTGADDYLPTPFDLDELEARIRALVRRAAPQGDVSAASTSRRESWFGMQIDLDSGAVYQGDSPLDLPPRELVLLRAVLANPGQVITKKRLFEMVFSGEPHIPPEATKVVAYRLRKMISHKGAQPVTLRGLGYLLKATA